MIVVESIAAFSALQFSGLSPDRVGELTLRAASRKKQEVWVAKFPELFYLYLKYYLPDLMTAMIGVNAKTFVKSFKTPKKLE